MVLLWELNKLAYIIGFTAGSSRRVASRVPHDVQNYGAPPNIEFTEGFKKSLAIGIKVGHNYIFECKTIKTNVTQNKNPLIAYKDMISITLPTQPAAPGGILTIPVVLSRQEKEEYGTKIFQLVVSFPSSLTCTNVESSSPWIDNFAYDIQSNQVIVQGERPTPTKDNTTICYLTFKVAESASGTLPLTILGSPGTGSGTELLVIKEDNELYYITPINFEDGVIKLDNEPSEPVVIGSNSTTMEGSSYVGSGGSYIDFNFGASFSVADGVTLSGGVNAIINVYLNGVLIGTSRVPLQQGTHDYTGSIELDKLDPIQEGEITVETKIECENEADKGFVYVYVKAGALFKLITKVTKEEERAGLPPERIKLKPYDKWYVYDAVILTIISGGGHEPIDLLITDTWVVGDNALIDTYVQKMYSVLDTMTIQEIVDFVHYDPNPTPHQPINEKITELLTLLDLIDIELNKATTKKDADTVSVSDSVAFTTHK